MLRAGISSSAWRRDEFDNVDVAVAAKPIANTDRLRNLVTAAVPEMLSPQHGGIAVSIPEAGFLIIDVPRSDDRPHFSNVHHQYFRRGSDGTRLMEHGEVRELMLAVRQASLELDWLIRSGGGFGDLRFALSIVLRLTNTSRVPVVAPYIRLNDDHWAVATVGPMTRRPSAGSLGIYASRDVLVHVEDSIELAEFETGLDFRRTGEFVLSAAIENIQRNGESSFAMARLSEMTPEAGLTRDRAVAVGGVFGAENVVARSYHVEIRKMDLLSKFCELHGINKSVALL